MEGKYGKIALFGAIAGVGTTALLKFVMPVLNGIAKFVPTVSLKLADASPGAISVSVRDSLTGIPGSFGKYLLDATGLSINNTWAPYLVSAIGGALFFLIGAYILTLMGSSAPKTGRGKTMAVIFLGSLAATAVFTWAVSGFPGLGFSFINLLIAFGINAAFLAWVYYLIDEKLKLNITPY